MYRITLLAMMAAIGSPWISPKANDPFKPKPPAEVDQALRERIKEFFAFHIKGTASDYRKAEALVAEDTKDYFYTHDKPKYISCEITKIDYSDNFTKATSIVTCDRYIMMPGFSDRPMKVPGTNTWKIENGKWYWYVDQDALLNTPFGRMKPGAFPSDGATPPPPSMANIPTNGDFLMSQVKMDPQSMRLKGRRDGARHPDRSSAPGPVDLVLNGRLAGVEAKFDDAKVKSGGTATL